jgi:hypothetical protein
MLQFQITNNSAVEGTTFIIYLTNKLSQRETVAIIKYKYLPIYKVFHPGVACAVLEIVGQD